MQKKPQRKNSTKTGYLLILAGGLAIGLGVLLLRLFTPQTTSVTPSPNRDPLEIARSSHKGLRVLFIGNSFTSYNDLPQLVRQLADAAKEDVPLIAVMQAPGGYTLQQHWDSSEMRTLLQEVRWNYVVLQEQSQGPSFDRAIRTQRMNPYIRQFRDQVQPQGGQILLYVTWGYQDGDQMNVPGDSFIVMNRRIQQGYGEVANELSLPMAPVSQAWEMALQQQPNLDLWSTDGKHPSLKGSYLAACVFYAVLYRKSPVGNSFMAGLEKSEAQFLQTMAAIATNQ